MCHIAKWIVTDFNVSTFHTASRYYGLSDPRCEELVGDGLSWGRFVGLDLPDQVPDEATLVDFSKRPVTVAGT